MDEDARPARDAAGEASRQPVEARTVGWRQDDPARLEPPLAEMMDLPGEKAFVESARRDQAILGHGRQRGLRSGQVAHGANVELLLAIPVEGKVHSQGIV